jgi:hypothetical protein
MRPKVSSRHLVLAGLVALVTAAGGCGAQDTQGEGGAGPPEHAAGVMPAVRAAAMPVVQAGGDGVAAATFTATAGTVESVNIVAGSPLAAGNVQFMVRVTRVRDGKEGV